MDDRELLREYVESQSQEAFAALVQRHLNLVYATALRLVRQPHTAEDVAQTVFIHLARKAPSIHRGNALPGWLYRVTCGIAKDLLRTDRRRRERENEAVKLAELETDDQALLSTLASLLDKAMQDLNETDQDVVVLRFLEGKSLRDTGQALGLSEDAAQKRVSRALEKMRAHFARRHIVASSGLIVTALEAVGAQLAPAGLAPALARAAVAVAAVAGTAGLLTILKTLLSAKAKIAVAIASGFAAAALAIFLLSHRRSANLDVTFHGLGDLPGGEFASYASGVSADGTVVVGMSKSARGNEAFRWTPTDGMVGLGDLSGGIFSSSAAGVSADGTVIAGTSVSSFGTEAFRWTEASGMTGIGDLPGDRFQSIAYGISGDGRAVVGESSSNRGEREAFRWTAVEGISGLGDLPGGTFTSYATGASTDGSVIVGISAVSSAGFEACRWTIESGLAGLGDFSGGATNSNGYGVSPDGRVVVGYGCPGTFDHYTHEAFRWTAAAGLVRLGFAPGLRNSAAYAVSADGNVIVGDNKSERIAHALVWDSERGMRRVEHVLTNDYKLNLAGWKLTSARAISHDGRTIVGSGVNPDGRNEAWIATFRRRMTSKGKL